MKRIAVLTLQTPLSRERAVCRETSRTNRTVSCEQCECVRRTKGQTQSTVQETRRVNLEPPSTYNHEPEAVATAVAQSADTVDLSE